MKTPVSKSLYSLRGLWGRYIRMRRDAKGVDVDWLRWLVTVCALTQISLGLLSGTKGRWLAGILGAGFGVLLLAYMGHFLLRRLQVSLLEWGVLMVVVGNMVGLLFLIMEPHAPLWALILFGVLLSATVLYGAVMGKAHAILLGFRGRYAHLGMMAVGWLGLLAPVLIACAVTLWFRASIGSGQLVSADTARWAWPMMILGVPALVLQTVVFYHGRRAARRVLTRMQLGIKSGPEAESSDSRLAQDHRPRVD